MTGNPESRISGMAGLTKIANDSFPVVSYGIPESHVPNVGRKCFESGCVCSQLSPYIAPVSLGFNLLKKVHSVCLKFLYSGQRIL